MKRRTYLAKQRHTRKRSYSTSTDPNKSARGNSRYARKKQWLHSHAVEQENGTELELWGFQVPAPKPWK